MTNTNETTRTGPGTALVASLLTMLFVSSISVAWWSSRGDEQDDGNGTPYIVYRYDNICGVENPKHISRPAMVDYPIALRATPFMEKLEREGIDPNSAEGIILRTKAKELVVSVCNEVRVHEHYCSIWKRIRRRDGEPVPDVSKQVLEGIAKSRTLASAGDD